MSSMHASIHRGMRLPFGAAQDPQPDRRAHSHASHLNSFLRPRLPICLNSTLCTPGLSYPRVNLHPFRRVHTLEKRGFVEPSRGSALTIWLAHCGTHWFLGSPIYFWVLSHVVTFSPHMEYSPASDFISHHLLTSFIYAILGHFHLFYFFVYPRL